MRWWSWGSALPTGRVHARPGPEQPGQRRQPDEDQGPETACSTYRTNPRHFDLAVVRLPLLSSAPEPAPHRMTAAAVRSRCLVPEGTSRQPTRDRPAGDFTGVTTAAACQEGHARRTRGRIHSGAGPAQHACRRRPVEGHSAVVGVRGAPRMPETTVDLTLVRPPPAGRTYAGAGPAQPDRRRQAGRGAWRRRGRPASNIRAARLVTSQE